MVSCKKVRIVHLIIAVAALAALLYPNGRVKAVVLSPTSVTGLNYKTYLPIAAAPPPPCPTTSSATYDAITFIGDPYKNNAITDENADFRLSILGYAPNNSALLDYIDYGGGGTTTDGPRLGDMFTPHRKPTFVRAYQVYRWNWNDGTGSKPPYGSRGAVNPDWGVTVLDVGTTLGESLSIPERNGYIFNPLGYIALVLYAGPHELTLAYMLQDQVVVGGYGYVVHMLNFCVDPNLVTTYRAQLDSIGKRFTHMLPALRNDQAVGTAPGITMTIAVRDGAAYMDPRGRTNWWYDIP